MRDARRESCLRRVGEPASYDFAAETRERKPNGDLPPKGEIDRRNCGVDSPEECCFRICGESHEGASR